MSPGRSWLARGFFVLLACVVALCLAELAARVWFTEWGPTRAERVKFWCYHADLGWVQEPGTRGRFAHPEFSVEVAINAEGLRDDEYPRERTGRKRMLVLGDSYAWGFGVEASARFSELLEQRHPGWEIINAAVSGYGTGQEFLYLQKDGVAFQPDVVLLLFSENDFTDNVRAEDYWHFRPCFAVRDGRLMLDNVPVPSPTLGQRMRRFLLGSTHLGSRLYLAKEALKRPRRGERPSEQAEMTHAVAVTGLLFKALDEYCREMGATLVMASVPMAEERRAVVGRIAAEAQIPYLALDPYFEADEVNFRFAHDEHWNADGHDMAAKGLDAFLRQMGIWSMPER